MRAYLDRVDQAPYRAVMPSLKPARVLAALGPRMLQLAADRADGAHTHFVTPEHTAQARKILGNERLLAVEQAVVLESDASRAREIARAHTSVYLRVPNYVNNLRQLGFSDDFGDGGSDRLVDAIVAWGEVTATIDRVRAHQAAGADHVCIQVLPPEPHALPGAEWRAIAATLLGYTGRRRSPRCEQHGRLDGRMRSLKRGKQRAMWGRAEFRLCICRSN